MCLRHTLAKCLSCLATNPPAVVFVLVALTTTRPLRDLKLRQRMMKPDAVPISFFSPPLPSPSLLFTLPVSCHSSSTVHPRNTRVVCAQGRLAASEAIPTGSSSNTQGWAAIQSKKREEGYERKGTVFETMWGRYMWFHQ